jgi:hypothetical protein
MYSPGELQTGNSLQSRDQGKSVTSLKKSDTPVVIDGKRFIAPPPAGGPAGCFEPSPRHLTERSSPQS